MKVLEHGVQAAQGETEDKERQGDGCVYMEAAKDLGAWNRLSGS